MMEFNGPSPTPEVPQMKQPEEIQTASRQEDQKPLRVLIKETLIKLGDSRLGAFDRLAEFDESDLRKFGEFNSLEEFERIASDIRP